MKIAFDLDGVLCNIDIVALNIIRYLGQEGKEMEGHYYRDRQPLLNPYQFLTDEDTFIIVTARRKKLWPATKRWIEKFLPGIKCFLIDEGYTTPCDIAKAKWKVLSEEEVDVYFDDNQGVIKALRALRDVSLQYKDIKFIQYGGRML